MTRRLWLLALALGACGGPVRGTPPAPAWQRELEGLEARHFLDHDLDAAGQARLAELLDFGAGDGPRADLVDAGRATPDAKRAAAFRAWQARDPQPFFDAAFAALEADPAAPGAAAIVAALGWTIGDDAALDDALRKRLPPLLARAHPDAAWLARLYLHRLAREARDLEAATAVDRALGRPTAWRIAGPFGTVAARAFDRAWPPEEAGRIDRAAPSFVADRALALGGHELDEIPTRRAVTYVQAACRVERPWAGEVRVAGPAAVRLRLDGRELLRREPFTGPLAGSTTGAASLAAGWHRLLLAVASEADTVPLTLHLARADGEPACAEWAADVPEGVALAASEALPTPTSALGALLEATSAYMMREAWIVATAPPLDDATAAARLADRWTRDWPGHAEGHYARAETWRVDPELPEALRRARARAAARTALDRAPGHVPSLTALAGLELAAGRHEAALDLAGRATRAAPRDPRPWLVQGDVFLAMELPAEVRRALDEASRRGRPRALLSRRVSLAEAERDVAGALSARAAVADTSAWPGSDGRAATCRITGDLACALERQTAAIERIGPDAALTRARFGLLVALDRDAAAEEAAAAHLALHPRDGAIHTSLGDLRFAAGDREGALAAWRAAARVDPPTDPATLDAADLAEEVDFDALFAIDGRALLAELAATKLPADLAEAFAHAGRIEVLDQWVAVVHPDGGVRHLTHRITLARTQEAADEIGELRLPRDARLLELRTLGADGEVVESEGEHGKGEVSFSRIGPGDAVEYRYADYEDPLFGDEGTAVGFVFRLEDAPVFRSDFTLLVPDGLPFEVEATQGPPAPEASRWRGYRVLRWRGQALSPLPREPFSVPHAEATPRVAVRVGVAPARLAERAMQAIEPMVRPGRVVNDTVEALGVRGESPDVAARALFAFVRDRIDGGDPDDMSRPASATIAGRHGNRTMALRALLRAAEVDAELLLAHRRDDLEVPRPELEPDYFHHPVVRVARPEGDLWLDPSADLAPFGHLDPALVGSTALAIERDPPVVVPLPETSPVPSRWTFDLALRVEPDGVVRGTLDASGEGAASLTARELLPTLAPANQGPTMERLFASALPGLHVKAVESMDLGDPDAPARVRLAVELPTVDAGGGRRVARRWLASPLAEALGESRAPDHYVVLERRETTLLVGHTDERVRVSIETTPGWRLEAGWASFTLDGPAGRVEQVVDVSGGGFRVDRQLRTHIQRVPPGDYPAFAEWARRVAEAVDEPIRFIRVDGEEE